WLVFPAPPGYAYTPEPRSVAGILRSARLRSSSATGAGPSTACPVGSIVPVVIALRARSVTGSSSSCAASLSMLDSQAYDDWTAPNPRIAPHGGLLVNTAKPSISACGTSYAPAAK